MSVFCRRERFVSFHLTLITSKGWTKHHPLKPPIPANANFVHVGGSGIPQIFFQCGSLSLILQIEFFTFHHNTKMEGLFALARGLGEAVGLVAPLPEIAVLFCHS